MAYSAAKFKVATSNGLGGDTFTRIVTHGQADDRPTLVRINIPFFLKKKAGIIR